MPDKLLLKNMSFYGYHGRFDAERELGQAIEVDLEVFMNLQNLGDETEMAFNYVDAYTIVKDAVEEREFSLIETIAETIATEILAAYTLEKATVRVRKRNVPAAGILDYLEVEITRGV